MVWEKFHLPSQKSRGKCLTISYSKLNQFLVFIVKETRYKRRLELVPFIRNEKLHHTTKIQWENSSQLQKLQNPVSILVLLTECMQFTTSWF